jgi:hypothetical protein
MAIKMRSPKGKVYTIPNKVPNRFWVGITEENRYCIPEVYFKRNANNTYAAAALSSIYSYTRNPRIKSTIHRWQGWVCWDDEKVIPIEAEHMCTDQSNDAIKVSYATTAVLSRPVVKPECMLTPLSAFIKRVRSKYLEI